MTQKDQDLISTYHDLIQAKHWKNDPYQEKSLVFLDRLLVSLKSTQKSVFSFFRKDEIPKGVYLYGGVGRGKSMIMDLFFTKVCLIEPKSRRVHFHQFMIETHDWLHHNRGQGMEDLLPRYARHVANHVRVLCFDEFHVTDVADAMILGRLFSELFALGLIVIATSNWVPDNLYEGGLQRDRFMPFIRLLKDKMHIVHLDNDKDYRQIADADQDMYYFWPLHQETNRKVQNLLSYFTQGIPLEPTILKVKGRETLVMGQGNVAYCSFSDLCEKPLAAEDYITLGQKFNTIFLTNVPQLDSSKRNEAKRLILLIDCLYESSCRLIISAQVDVDNLYNGDDHEFEFKRTISRLMEMQSTAYHQKRMR